MANLSSASEQSEINALFRTMADTAPVLIWMSDTDKRCTFFNKTWLEFTGRTQEQEYGNGWAEGVHPEDFDRCLKIYTSSFDERTPFEMEYRLRRFDGVYRWILDRGVARYNNGIFTGYIGSCIDITDRKEVETERLHLFELEKTARTNAENANQMKDQFLATLSHELRTPLTPILGWVSLLLNGNCDAETTRHSLQVIERNTRIQIRLVDDLLDVSRIISGKLHLNIHTLDLVPVIKAAVENVQAAAEAKEITIQTHFSSPQELMMGDSDRIQQIVWNLLSNAVKFSPRKSTVHLSLKRPAENEVELQVRDSGVGIAPEISDHIFERFSQADTSRIRATGGLGIGLAIVRHLVEMHGGTVSVFSEGHDTGATFTVLLPTPVGKTKKGTANFGGIAALLRSPLRAPVAKLQSVHVLLVEDDRDSLECLKVAFEQCGAIVRTAISAKDALESVSDKVPDVIVSDIAMPLQDGYDLMKSIRKLPPEKGGSVPAVALTAFARVEDRRIALDAGFSYHFSKPVDLEELTTTVASLVFKNR